MQKSHSLILFGFALMLITGHAAHPVYISVTNLDFLPDSGVKISVRINAHDIAEIINSRYNTELSFNNRSRITTHEQDAIVDYINEKLIIRCDSINFKYTFTAWRLEMENIVLFFRFFPELALPEVVVTNSMLIEVFSNQVNMVIVNNNREEKGIIFNKRETVQTIVLSD